MTQNANDCTENLFWHRTRLQWLQWRVYLTPTSPFEMEDLIDCLSAASNYALTKASLQEWFVD